mgnify:CR=1 FL=1
MVRCFQCGRQLTADEIAVYRKMVNREADKFLCKTCLADYFGVDEDKIDKKIEQFKRIGCLLFVQSET